jgi:hypothetical protein
MKAENSAVKKGNIEFTRQKMVRWYDPRQLFYTAVRVLLSSVFSTYADKRESFAATGDGPVYTLDAKAEVWLDYIADLGDGWNPTYYTAYLLAQEQLRLADISLPRADVLVMGGDQVYPTASRDEYQNRLWGPYECAFPREKCTSGPAPRLFAIPGNHDWYDGLNNFVKLFCQQRHIGAWDTQQHRSYFALQVTANCWLWGIDIQLNSDIDKPQLDYFKMVATRHMADGDHVILCTAEPAWVGSDKTAAKEKYEKLAYFRRTHIDKVEYKERVNDQLTTKVRQLHLVLLLAGDLHHYARYTHTAEGRPPTHHITAGGGGTFLHPTHNLPGAITWYNKHSRRNETFTLKKAFPDKDTSASLLGRNLLFPFKNPTFCFFLGFVYMLLGWILQSSSILYGSDFTIHQSLFKQLASGTDFLQTITLYMHVLWFNPAALLLIGVILVGFAKFTDTHSVNHKTPVVVLGLIHGLLHVLLALFVIWLYSYLNQFVNRITGWPGLLNLFPFVGGVVLMYGIGGILGGFLTGLYLIAANGIFKVHDNEAFSAIRHQDHKNFLRMHISSRAITLYPIGITRVPRQWQEASGTGASPSLFEPAAAENLPAYELIERPVVIPLPGPQIEE